MSAVMSADQQYRYRLTRDIALSTKGTVCFVMLNPSTADAVENDPTIRRCIGYAQLWRHNLEVVNLFALRSTDLDALYGCSEAVAIGPENDRHIIEAAQAADLVVCAWGIHGVLHSRGRRVIELLRAAGVIPTALGLTKDGHPKHPLYLPKTAEPKEMKR